MKNPLCHLKMTGIQGHLEDHFQFVSSYINFGHLEEKNHRNRDLPTMVINHLLICITWDDPPSDGRKFITPICK